MRSILAFLAFMLPGAAFACSPSNAPIGSIGCLPSLGAPQTGDLIAAWRPSTYPASAGTLSYSALLGAYLPLTGGTLTGALTGISATLTGSGTALTLPGGNAPGAAGLAATGTNALMLGNATTGTSLMVEQQPGDTGTNANWIYVEGSNAGSHFAKISSEGTESYGNLVADCYEGTTASCAILFNPWAQGTQFQVYGSGTSTYSWQASGNTGGNPPTLYANTGTAGGAIQVAGTAPLYFASTTYGNIATLSGNGHFGFEGTPIPVASACGTSPTVVTGSTDTRGSVTEGTTATGCTVTFSAAYGTAPFCVVSSPNGAPFTSYTASTTALTIVNVSASGDDFTWVCMQ